MTFMFTPGLPEKSPTADAAWTDTFLTFVKWCQGRTDIKTNLHSVAAFFGAEAASLSRWDDEKGVMRVACAIDSTNQPHLPRLTHAFADVICGDYVNSLKPGAALLLSEANDGRPVNDAGLARWMFKRGIRDIGIICIGADAKSRDVIELHFRTPAGKNWASAQASVGHSLAEVFAGRRRGLMLEALLSSVRHTTSPRGDLALLDPANPAGLTRSEWKICALIANGLSRDGVAKELGIKSSTVQTHLRNIYSKTGYERFHELALHLVSPFERAHLSLVAEGLAA